MWYFLNKAQAGKPKHTNANEINSIMTQTQEQDSMHPQQPFYPLSVFVLLAHTFSAA